MKSKSWVDIQVMECCNIFDSEVEQEASKKAAEQMARALLEEIEKLQKYDGHGYEHDKYTEPNRRVLVDLSHIKALFEAGEGKECEHYWVNVLHEDHIRCCKCGLVEKKEAVVSPTTPEIDPNTVNNISWICSKCKTRWVTRPYSTFNCMACGEELKPLPILAVAKEPK